jgi:hypothetical protein
MELGFGGPVWHASVHRQGRSPVDPSGLLAAALRALRGVGDPQLGEWHEHTPGGRTFHVKRRVTDAELPNLLIDVRGTNESARRLEAVRAVIPVHLHPMIGDW